MKTKRIITAILIAVMLLIAVPFGAHAANWGEGDTLEDALSELKVAFHSTRLDWLVLPNLGVIEQRYTYFLYRNERTGQVDEHPVYCIDPTRGGAYEIVRDVGPNSDGSSTATYIRGEKAGDYRYKAILAAGFPQMRLESLGLQTDEEGYYATKVALWMYIRDNDASMLTINPAYGDSDPVAKRVREAAADIYARGMAGYPVDEPKLTLTAQQNATATLDAAGEYYVQSLEVFASGWVGVNTDSCGDVQLFWEKKPPNGTIVLGSSGEDISSTMAVTMGYAGESRGWHGHITIKYPVSAIDPATFNPPTLKAEAIVLNDGIYIAYAKVSTDKYQRYLVTSDPKVELAASFISQISYEPFSDDSPESGLRIRKVQKGTDTPLEGAVFEIRNPEGKLIYSLVTDGSGTIEVPLNVSGNYTVTETTPPQYHLPPANKTQSVFVNDGEVAEITFVNEPYGTLRVVKRDAQNGATLSGATVRIRNLVANTTQEKITDSSGSAVFEKLPIGAYEIVEMTAPDGYALDPAPHTVNVVSLSAGETSYTLTNRANPGLRIRKFDRQSMTPIAGVTFEVWRDGELVGSYVTDALGVIELRNIPAGTYIARETATAAPYALDATAQWVEIRAGQGYISELVFLNLQKPGIRIMKIDSATFEPLSNARFAVAKVGGAFAKEFTADNNGEINLSELEPGAYTVRETTAPDGYLIDGAARTIQINAGESAQFVFTNTPKPKLCIVKTDANTGKPIEGVTFTVRKVDSSTVSTVKTDSNGEAWLSGLDEGVYQITEQSVPPAYLLDKTPQLITLIGGRTGVVRFQNFPRPALRILKVDMITGETLANAEFRVSKVEGGTVSEYITDKSGAILVEGLDDAIYRAEEFMPPDGYVRCDEYKQIQLEPGKTSTLKFDNIRKPTLIISKTNALTFQPIPNTVFRIEYELENGGVKNLGNYRTDENGQIVILRVDPGWYIITEVQAAPGFSLPSNPVTRLYLSPGENAYTDVNGSGEKGGDVSGNNVRVTSGNDYIKGHEILDYPLNSIVIRKADAVTGELLAGAEFAVRQVTSGISGSSGTLIGRYTTDSSGTIVITGLVPGGYIIEESKAPANYMLSENAQQQVWLKPDGTSIVETTFANFPYGAILIAKVDAQTNKPLANARFRVTDSSGAVVGNTNGEYISDSNGEILIPNVKPGSYVVTEVEAPEHYVVDTTPQTIQVGLDGKVYKVSFKNQPATALTILKLDSVTREPLSGAEFRVTMSDGSVVGTGNGRYTTDSTGQIIIPNLPKGSYIVQEVKAPAGYILENQSQTIAMDYGKPYTLEFFNKPLAGLQIIKIDSETRKPIAGVSFSVSKMNGERIGEFTTDKAGTIFIPELESGWYTIVETRAASGYIIDSQPRNVEVKWGAPVTLTFENTQMAGLRILKIDSVTKKPIYGVEFMVFDSSNKVVGTYITDNNGVIDFAGILPAGRYTLRETRAAAGYYRDDMPRTIEFKPGKVTEVVWENVPEMGQIQITKLSGDNNEINGLPKGTPLAGAVFEVYNYRTGNLVDRFVSGTDGRAVSKPLPLGRYTVKEVQAPQWYKMSEDALDIEIEFATQIIRREFLNYSANTGVTIRKTGNLEAMPGDTIRYDIKAVSNDSTVPLTDFYWRDVLPTDAVRLNKIVTGTYNQGLRYKVMVTTNKGDTRVIADNLSTTVNNVINCSAVALGLRSDEYVTSFTLVFGTVKAGFCQVTAPQIYVTVNRNLPNGYEFANKCDVGGKYGSEWIIGASAWRTVTYAPQSKMPRTGY